MSNRVLLYRCPDYDERHIDQAISKVFESFQFVFDTFKPREKVLLKPNLLVGRPAEACVNTHPFFVRALVKRLLDYRVRILIGDSPALGSTRRAVRKSGLERALVGLPVEYVEFNDSIRLDGIRGGTYKNIEVARIVTEVEHIINLPKIKTHGQMVMTLAVKNLFGCVVGLRKQEWHLKAGMSQENFADMLVELAAMIRPDLTIVDGIMGMEGNGPQNGDPVKIGLVVAGQDLSAIDRVILACLRVEPERVHTMVAAQKKSLGFTKMDTIALEGEAIEDCHIDRFILPGIHRLSGNRIPGFLVRRLKEYLVERPVIIKKKCSLCQSCITVCPPQIMSLTVHNGQKKVVIDRKKCIHCFCCQEICPENAIRIRTRLSFFFRFFDI
ncbi:DUF362 domain-containing protein [bacterium]|nr:DUF362 domain-containing protein [bacterium]